MRRRNRIKRRIKHIKASAYLWHRHKKGAVKQYKLLWGLIENSETGKVAVKFIAEFDKKKLAIWITDMLSVLTIQTLMSDFIRMKEGKQEENLDDLLPQLEEGVNRMLQVLRTAEAERKRYEQVIIECGREWLLTREQTEKMLCLMIASKLKLAEEMFSRGEQFGYIY